MQVRITEAMIQKAAPGEKLRDNVVPGLICRRGKAGAAWSVWYRSKVDGVERSPSVGKWPGVGVAAARDAAKLILASVAAGGDPAVQRAEEKARAVRKLGDLRIEFERLHFPRLKKRTRESYRQSLDLIVERWGAGKLLTKIKIPDVVALHSEMADIPVKANRVLATLSAVWNKAEFWGWVPKLSNPTVGIERYKESERRRLPSDEELVRVGEALRRRVTVDSDFCACLMLIVLTGARGRSEIIKAHAEWVTSRGLELPDSKTGFKVVPLPPRARLVIEDLLESRRTALPMRHGPKSGGRQVPVATYARPIGRLFGFGERAFLEWWHEVRREAAAPDLWLHDLRRFFVSVGLNHGASLGQMGLVVGHKDERTTKRYAWMMTAPATATAAAVTDRVVAMIEPPKPAPAAEEVQEGIEFLGGA